METTARPPDISVVLVSDYAAGGDMAWNSLRRVLESLGRQKYAGTAEFLLVERAEYLDRAPPGLLEMLPGLRVVPSAETGSYELKNRGAREARAPILAMLDTDCLPAPGWLEAISAAFAERPEAAVISGRTLYPGIGQRRQRLAALLERSYVDCGKAGATMFISNNNAGWRRLVYLAHPLPAGLGPFAGRIQSEAVRRSGGKLFFDPSLSVAHDYHGWRMEADIHRNAGYGTVITRLNDPEMPYAWLVRLGRFSIPLFIAGKTIHRWRDILRCWSHFGLRFYELPAALGLGAVLSLLESWGMWLAFAGQPIPVTAYR